jgi:uncharacterized protein
MKNEWVSPRIIIGKDATGAYYYRREEIENEILSEIKKGNNILIAAPRRVGKTSVMKYLEAHEVDGYIFKFRNVEGIASEKEFYKTIYELILSCLTNAKQKWSGLKDYLNSKKIAEISLFEGGFKFEDKEHDYLSEINQLIPKLNKESNSITLLIDELPSVLHNLYIGGKIQEAKNIIKNLRHWRQERSYEKLQFVLAGSVGIHYVVNLINERASDLNDLKKIKYQPLDVEHDEVLKYIDWATKDVTITYSNEMKTHLMSKIKYYVPYFINLMLDEIDRTARKKREYTITTKDIDVAFDKIVNNSEYFIDWKKRLSDYMPATDFAFVNELLIHIAHKEKITIQEIYDKAVKHNITNNYMEFIKDLIQDGYIVETNKNYLFISPFLQEFWKQDNPIYNG